MLMKYKMDLYGLQNSGQGNALTSANELYNEQVRSTRDRINNMFDMEKISGQQQTDKDKSAKNTDSLIYEAHDAISGVGLGSAVGTLRSVQNEYDKIKGTGASYWDASRNIARSTNPNANLIFGSATTINSKPAQVSTAINRTPPTSTGVPTSRLAETPIAPSAGSGKNILSGVDDVVNSEAGKVVSQVAEGGSKFLKAGTDIAGAVSAFELAKNGFQKNADGSYDKAGDIAQVGGVVTTALDIVGTFIPPVEAIGAVAGLVTSVASSIDTFNKDKATVDTDTSTQQSLNARRTSQLSQLGALKSVKNPVNQLAGSGLVSTGARHIQTMSNPSGAF